MALSYRDTLSGRRVEIGGRRGSPVTLYVCGPTVYAPAHVGHARTYLCFDLLRRYFASVGVPVRHVMNVTDVEDKIDQRARELGIAPLVLARREETRFFRDLDRLRILPPTWAPRAGDFVPAMIRIGRKLERSGRVRREGDSWFYTPPRRSPGENFAVADELERHSVREPETPSGIVPDPREFLIWKRQDGGLPSWDSPWGRGVPGWHLECYAMADRYLGVPIDVQGGGQDLVFPHHYAQNEIALTLTGHPFARGFLHTGFVLQDGRKMSKSIGNLTSLGPALQAHGGSALRWFLLSRPPGAPLDWTEPGVSRAAAEFGRVRASIASAVRPGAGGTVRRAEVQRLRHELEARLAGGLAVDRAFARLRAWSESLDRRAAPGAARGERTGVREELQGIEALTGLRLLPGPSRTARRPGAGHRGGLRLPDALRSG